MAYPVIAEVGSAAAKATGTTITATLTTNTFAVGDFVAVAWQAEADTLGATVTSAGTAGLTTFGAYTNAGIGNGIIAITYQIARVTSAGTVTSVTATGSSTPAKVLRVFKVTGADPAAPIMNWVTSGSVTTIDVTAVRDVTVHWSMFGVGPGGGASSNFTVSAGYNEVYKDATSFGTTGQSATTNQASITQAHGRNAAPVETITHKIFFSASNWYYWNIIWQAPPPDVQVTAELWEAGVFRASLGTVSADALANFEVTWDASVLADPTGAGVEIRLTAPAGFDLDSLAWDAKYGQPSNRTGGGSASGNGTLTATSTVTASGIGTTSGSGALTATQAVQASSTANTSGAGSVTGAGVQGYSGSGSLSGAGSLSAVSVARPAGAGAASGTGTATGSGSPKPISTASLAGSGTVVGVGTPALAASGSLSGAGQVTGSSNASSASLAGTGTLTTAGTPGVASANATNPAAIPNLLRWWKADDITGTADGAAITSWPAAAGASLTPEFAGTGAAPVYVAASSFLNNKPAARWNGTTNRGLVSSLAAQTSTGFTAFVVAYVASSNTGNRRIFQHGGGDSELRLTHEGGQLVANVAGNALGVLILPVGSHVVGSRFNQNVALEVNKNGVAVGGPAPALNWGVTANLTLGSKSGGVPDGDTWHGDIAEVLFYDRALTDVERNRVTSYLSDKYGVAVVGYTAGGPSVSGAGTVSGMGSTPVVSGVSSTSGNGSLTAVGAVTTAGTATTSGAGSVTATGTAATSGSSALTGNGSIVGTGTMLGAAALNAPATLSGAVRLGTTGALALNAGAVLGFSAAPVVTTSGQTTLNAPAALSTSAGRLTVGAASVNAPAAVAVTGSLGFSGAASLNAAATITSGTGTTPVGVGKYPGTEFAGWQNGIDLRVELRFTATTGQSGHLLNQTEQSSTVYGGAGPAGHVPAVYIDTNGFLRSSLFWHGNTGFQIATTTTVTDGLPHTVVVTYSAGVQTMLLDGVVVGTLTTSQTDYSSSYAYFIGQGYQGGGWPLLASGWTTFPGQVVLVQGASGPASPYVTTSGQSSLNAPASVAVAASRSTSVTASLNAPATLASVTDGTSGSAALNSPATLASAATLGTSGSASLLAPATLATSGFATRTAAVSLLAPATLATSGTRTVTAAAALLAPAALATAAFTTTSGAASLLAPATVGTSATRATVSAAALASPAALAVTTPVGSGSGAAALAAPALLTTNVTPSVLVAAALNAPVTLAGTAARGSFGAVVLNAQAALTLTAKLTMPVAVQAFAPAALLAGGLRATTAATLLVAPAALAATGTRTTSASAGLNAPGVLVNGPIVLGASSTSMTASTNLSVGTVVAAVVGADLLAPASLSVVGTRVVLALVQMLAGAELTAYANVTNLIDPWPAKRLLPGTTLPLREAGNGVTMGQPHTIRLVRK